MECDEIYGVDLNEKITPVMVRDAIIRCFINAHNFAFNQMRKMDFTMSDEEFKKELEGAVKDQNLEHVETQESKAEMILKFKGESGAVVDFPECPQHGQLTFTEGSDTLTCDEPDCDHTAPVPMEDGKPMKPFIAKV